jgi:hypothetical protein
VTAAAGAENPIASNASQPAWLFNAALDLLLGAGGIYLLSVPVLFWYTSQYGIEDWGLLLVAFSTVVISAPHYGATLIRVYDRSEDRHRYRLFAVWLSLLCLIVFVVALHLHVLGSLLLTLYVSWTPWHFAGQNYGVAMTFLRRSKAPVSPLAKRLLYASFILSAAIAILSVHVQDGSANYSAGTATAGAVYDVMRLGIPTAWASFLLAPLLIAYLASGVIGLGLIARQSSARSIFGPLLLMATQALWFAVPAALRMQGLESGLALAFAAIWVSTCHSAQYLWITSYYAGRAESPMRTRSFLWKSLLSGSAITIVPGLVFAPAVLGTVSWDAGLAVLVFSVVNLHHFILDGAVWKLRDGPVARALLHSTGPIDFALGNADERASEGRVLGPLLATLGVASLVVPAVMTWELLVALPTANRELTRLEASAQRLSWIGRDHPVVLSALASLHMQEGQIDAALRAYRSANRVLPTPLSRNNLAWLLATERSDDAESAAEAVALATLASAALDDREPSMLDTLAAGYAAQGKFGQATRTSYKAWRIASAAGQDVLAKEIAGRLQLYRAGKTYHRATNPGSQTPQTKGF